MVRLRNLHSSKRARSLKPKIQLNHESLRQIFKGTNGSAIKLVVRSGKFTSCDKTLAEASVNNKVLRIPLKRYNFNALKGIHNENELSNSIGSSKRKRNSHEVSIPGQTPNKKFRINGSSISNRSVTFRHENLKNSKLQKDLKSIEHTTNNSSRDSVKKQTFNTKSQSYKTFDKSKFKIRLVPKKIKKEAQNPSKHLAKVHNARLHTKSTNSLSSCTEDNTYYLKFKKEKAITEGVLNYKFQTLITDVKNLNLPSPSWKIKVIIRHNKISAITFTNKQEPERSVTFSSEVAFYKLIFDNKSACLLGSPKTIENAKDIEIFLDIVNCLEPEDPVIFYK